MSKRSDSYIALHGTNIWDIVENNSKFDTEWYREAYGDLFTKDMSPAKHFSLTGQGVERPINNTPDGLTDARNLLDTASARIKVSFCIPILNRLSDLEHTLRSNLQENEDYQNDIEFLVSVLSDSDPSFDWIRDNFSDYLNRGYLRIIQPRCLENWHFSIAKNSFKGYLRGKYYSSLDADNFVDPSDVRELLDIMHKETGPLIIHHFSGVWGDGTSGRVTLPRAIYNEVGYDDRLLWRQFDEMDMIISTICAFPGISFYRKPTLDHALSSVESSRFAENLHFEERFLQEYETQKTRAINQKKVSYVQDNPHLSSMTLFNMYASFEKNERDPKRQEDYRTKARNAGFRYLERAGEDEVRSLMRLQGSNAPKGPVRGIALFACMKNDERFLAPFYDHYSMRGVEHFFFVDDGSDVKGCEAFSRDNVYWFEPKFGRFGTSKVLWLKALMSRFVVQGAWTLMVDADEFVDLPPNCPSFKEYGQRLQNSSSRYAQGILLDLVPDIDSKQIDGNFVSRFDSFLKLNTSPSSEYLDRVSWAFGDLSQVSWSIDVRFHLLGTIDCLRKVPFFRYSPQLIFNQGFHNLQFGEKASDGMVPAITGTENLLPVRHYKLSKYERDIVLSNEERSIEGYYYETRKNIEKLYRENIFCKLEKLEPGLLTKYTPDAFFDMFLNAK
ncbi:MAG: glycosyltransferase family 2 protein [Rhizobiaceae bacterium]|nr:glycosyltransferase family 2 protein [Rhizobiaceae bacterium]